jgi:hypothetical protein
MMKKSPPNLVAAFSMIAVINLSACGQLERNIDERIAFPRSQASLVIESDSYGGGAGSVYRDVFIVNGEKREKVVSGRSLYPLKVSFNDDGRTVTVGVCKGRIFSSKEASVLPYGNADPVYIRAEVTRSCGR